MTWFTFAGNYSSYPVQVERVTIEPSVQLEVQTFTLINQPFHLVPRTIVDIT
jgi:hypothetical protein